MPVYIIPTPVVHEITYDLYVRNIPNLAHFPVALGLSNIRRASVDISPLWVTSSAAFGRVDLYEPSLVQTSDDIDGPFILAAAVEDITWQPNELTRTRIVAITSTRFFHPENLRIVDDANWQFAINSFRWMKGF